jgi:hypothetical protein
VTTVSLDRVLHDLLAYDQRLSRRLARDARAAARARLRAEIAHAHAVRRREKAVARARQRLPRQTLVAVVAAVASLPLDATQGWLAMVASGAAGVGAFHSLRTLQRPPLPALRALPVAPPTAPPPHPRSAAFPAVRRLEVVRDELRRLLPLVAPAGRDVAQEAWCAAAEADGALRWQAARLAAVEQHRGAEDALLRPLYEGVACQERLLGAVVDLVAASADPLATGRLQDATDALHGLAQGLRAVR